MVAAMLGKPLMQWQHHVADVLHEIDPDTGQLAYDEWTLTVPRQSGKSTFILAKASHRCSAGQFFGPNQQIAYTAQTKLKATEKFEKDYSAVMQHSKRIRARLRTGNMKVDIRYPNGSIFGVEAGTEKSGHGSVLDEAYVDEAFSQVDNRMEQAFGPAMITRANKQLGAVSTAGWLDASPYLLGKVEAGRRLVESDVRKGTAYFEWSAPEDADPGDEAVWLETMPAVHRPECPHNCKRHTVPLAAIRREYEKAVASGKLSDFRRAYLNQWLKKPQEAEETALGDWASCSIAVPDETPAPLALGIGGDLDREWVSFATAAQLEDRTLLAKVDRRAGTDWAAAEAVRIQREHGIPIVMCEKGPVADLGEAIEDLGGTVTRVKFDGYVTACAAIFDAVKYRTVAHVNHEDLNNAVKAARWRIREDRKVFGRAQSEADISMLEAATLALTEAVPRGDILDTIG